MLRLFAAALFLLAVAGCDSAEPLTSDPSRLIGSWTFESELACGDGSGGCVETPSRDEQITFRSDGTLTQVRDGDITQEGPYETTESSVYLIRENGRSWLGIFEVNRRQLVLSTAPADGPTTTYRRVD